MRATARLSDDAYVELVRSVFATMLPTLVMSVLFACVGGLAVARSVDRPLRWLVAAGIMLSLARVVATLRFGRRLAEPGIAPGRVRRIEHRFALLYVGFAVLLGAFAARAYAVLPPDAGLLASVLIVGYAAGVSSGAGLRPWIGIPSMIVAVVPTIVVAAAGADAAHEVLALTLTGLLVGGIRSTLVRYRASLEGIAMRRSVAELARRDHLTGLPNRLAVTERFRRVSDGEGVTIVRYIDLDEFKPVNDRYGHPAGDAVLRGVADRLRSLLGRGDFAARLGGDEFLLVQTGLARAEDGAAMSRRMAELLAEPYVVNGTTLHVGASVGEAMLGPEADIAQAIASADEALLRSKRDHRRLQARAVLARQSAAVGRR